MHICPLDDTEMSRFEFFSHSGKLLLNCCINHNKVDVESSLSYLKNIGC